MKTLKKGDKGDDVRTLQKALSRHFPVVVVDGDFGQKTYDAVKLFQEIHDLEADGICGPKTWAALGVKEATNTKAVDSSVVYYPLSKCLTKSSNRSIKYLVIHYTAGASSAAGRAKSNKATWEKKGDASADFAVDDATMVQFNPDPKNYYCWGVGGGNGIVNKNSIHIEICSNLKKGANASKANHEGWYFTEESLENAVKLAKILMQKYNIPIERVVRHYDSTGKYCPGIIGYNNGQLYDMKGNKLNKKNNSDKWLEFKNRLK